MSNKDLARRAEVSVSFNDVDITQDMKRYFLSLTYTDQEEDETDDLQIKLQDADGIWTKDWLTEIVNAAAAKESGSATIRAAITRLNWNGDGKDDQLQRLKDYCVLYFPILEGVSEFILNTKEEDLESRKEVLAMNKVMKPYFEILNREHKILASEGKKRDKSWKFLIKNKEINDEDFGGVE